MTFQTLKLNQIQPSNDNPRKSFDDKSIEGLAQSIKTDGLLQSLTVAKPKGKKKKHPIICGERRYRALLLLQTQGDLPKDYEVNVEVKSDLDDDQILRIATVENMQRENLPALEEARALASLVQDGEKLDDIVAQTGLSVSTIQRRLILVGLSENVQEALSQGEITLAQAEALSLGTHEKQDDLLESVKDDDHWLSDPESIKDRFVGRLPTVSMAIFPIEEYQGDFTHDLLAEEDQTYFNDVDQFLERQKAAAENLVEHHAQNADWAELCEGYFSSWEYGQAEGEQIGGVIVSIDRSGEVEIHEGLVKREVDKDTAKKLKKPRPTYGRPLVVDMSMHKSMAVQKALFENPRIAKEIAVVQMMVGSDWTNNVDLKAHSCLSYFEKRDVRPASWEIIEAEAKALAELLGAEVWKQDDFEDDANACTSLIHTSWSREVWYEAVKQLSDDSLERLHVFLTILCFGQGNLDRLDTNENSLFNRVAKDLGVDMRDYWRPDEEFLKRRNKVQLQKIIDESGSLSKIGHAASRKKKDLVSSMAKHFQDVLNVEAPNEDQLKAQFWLPEAMAFPAIDPDAKDFPSDVDIDAEEGFEAEDVLAEAA